MQNYAINKEGSMIIQALFILESKLIAPYILYGNAACGNAKEWLERASGARLRKNLL